jgi:VWFA-related protein
MRKVLTATLFLFFICSAISAQTADSVKSPNYSESVSYQPREFKFNSSKLKKQKKAKKENKEKIVSPVVEPLAAEDSLIKEDKLFSFPIAIFDGDGGAVLNLKKEDFKVFVDDEEREIQDFNASEQSYNLILILDVSPSTAFQIEDIREYAMNLVKQLRPQDKVMVIKFDEKTEVLTELTNDRNVINKAIEKAKFGDGTSLYQAVKFSLQKRISRINGRKMVVMLTDGVDTTSRKATLEDSLYEAEKNDAPFFPVYLDTYQNLGKVVGGRVFPGSQIPGGVFPPNSIILGGMPDMKEEYALGRFYLDELAHLSGGRTVAVKDLSKSKLTGFEGFFEAFRNQYNLSFQPPENGKIGQRRQIRVRVNRPNLYVQARGSYIVGGNILPSSK